MNAVTAPEVAALQLRLSSPYAQTATVEPYGFPMVCEYEHDEGEAPIVNGGPDNWHPGSPPNAVLLTCRVGGVDITDMLSSSQVERLEEAILEQLES
jgi:hypothetical protein